MKGPIYCIMRVLIIYVMRRCTQKRVDIVLYVVENGGMKTKTENVVLMTVSDAARISKVPYWTLQAWIHKGRLPVVHQGRSVFIMRGELEQVLRGICPLCGDRFQRGNARQVYCSDACRKNAHRTRKAEGGNK